MILTGTRISEEVARDNIRIIPFDSSQVNPNSYDFRLGSTLKIYKNYVLDVRHPNETVTITIPEHGFILQPDKLYLGHTEEKIGSDVFVPILHGKSSTGRVGLFVHISAGLMDLGSHGQQTLMLHAIQPIKVYPGMRIGQVTFWTVLGEPVLYNGKYQDGEGPQASQVYKDFE